MTQLDVQTVRECIAQVAVSEAELSHQAAQDVAFHMTDWLADLEAFVQSCQRPEDFSAGQVDQLLLKFLVHVPNHLAAAAKLYADFPVTDIFAVGAVSHGPQGTA